MKSLLRFVITVLSVVRSDETPGVLRANDRNVDYIACDITPVAYPDLFSLIFLSGRCWIENSNMCLGARLCINLCRLQNRKPHAAPLRCPA
jgi:hypothetical protein